MCNMVRAGGATLNPSVPPTEAQCGLSRSGCVGEHMTTEPKVLFRQIGSFSGPVIRGKKPAFATAPQLSSNHLLRAFWLTTMVESGGKLGSVMMADGTGATASLEQVIAVYPRNMKEQGPLFKLLNRIDAVAPVSYYLNFYGMGWRISEDGVLRDKQGKPVAPKLIRDTFTPVGGRVPQSAGDGWKRSKEWAIGFHQLFSLDQTRDTQVRCGIEHITKFAKRVKSKKLLKHTVEDICYGGEVQNPNPFFPQCPQMDLAMCMWWNYKTNAPSPALKALNEARLAFFPLDEPEQFARCLLNKLRTSRYGRWGTNRYDRSREHAMAVWPPELFEGPDAVMPARKTR